MPTRPDVKYYDIKDYGEAMRAVDIIEARKGWAILHYQQFGRERDHYEIWAAGHSRDHEDTLDKAQIFMESTIRDFMRGNSV